MKGHVNKSGDVLFAGEKNSAGLHLATKGLTKHNEIIQNHQNTSFDSLKPFSDSYSTIWDDLCNNFESFLKIPKIVGKSSACPSRSVFHAIKSFQMPYTTKNDTNLKFTNRIKNPLELRQEVLKLAVDMSRSIQVGAGRAHPLV